jgi:nucleoside-diphosphate-sugar epimerase
MMTLPLQDLAHVWAKARNSLSLLRGQTLFITGGTGLFGIWLLESIQYANEHHDADIKAVILTRNISKFFKTAPHLQNASFFTFIEGDVTNFVYPEGAFSYVIHAATEASDKLNKEHPLLMFNTITQGTRRVLKFAVEKRAQGFLFASSGAVYGKQPAELQQVPETYVSAPNPLLTTSAYGIGKLAAEHMSVLFHQQFALPIKIARCFAFVGPYLPLNTHFAIGNFIAQALKNEPIHILGDGSPFRSYLYMADLTAWLWTILCYGKAGEAYNVGSDQAICIEALANLVATQVTPSLPIHIAQAKDAAIPAERYVPSIAKAQQELGLTQWITLPEALSRTLFWNQSHAKT